MKKSNILVTILCTAILSTTTFFVGVEAGTPRATGVSFNSQGVIKYDDPGTAGDDVVFDASDFTTIGQVVADGKASLVTEINKYGSQQLDTNIVHDFNTLATAIDTLTDSADVAANEMLTGKTAYVKGAKVTGTMANKSGTTSNATTVTESGDNALISIPANGYYTTGSKLSVPVETIKNNVSSLNSSLIVDALQNKSSDFDVLDSTSTCPEIATAIENSNLSNYELYTNNSTEDVVINVPAGKKCIITHHYLSQTSHYYDTTTNCTNMEVESIQQRDSLVTTSSLRTAETVVVLKAKTGGGTVTLPKINHFILVNCVVI